MELIIPSALIFDVYALTSYPVARKKKLSSACSYQKGTQSLQVDARVEVELFFFQMRHEHQQWYWCQRSCQVSHVAETELNRARTVLVHGWVLQCEGYAMWAKWQASLHWGNVLSATTDALACFPYSFTRVSVTWARLKNTYVSVFLSPPAFKQLLTLG